MKKKFDFYLRRDFKNGIAADDMKETRRLWIALIFSVLVVFAFAQHGEHGTQQPAEQHSAQQPAHTNEAPAHSEANGCGGHEEHGDGKYDASGTALHHIANSNAIHIVGNTYFNLPCILYAPAAGGWKFIGSTAAFKAEEHGTGSVALDGYVLHHGEVKRVADPHFPQGEVEIGNIFEEEFKDAKGKDRQRFFVCYNNTPYLLDAHSTLDGGLMGGGITSFYDFSLSKNVFTMLLACFFVFFAFRAAAKAYTRRDGQAPTGLQNFLEPLYLFLRDDVAKPVIGPRYEKYMPYLLSAFFFVLGLNLIGQIPFFPGGGNVTGNISITIVLAVITFIITTINGNKHYWEHIVWMPGVPAILKILLITPIEILGIFLKPLTLLLRLFANIAAGHIVILSFVGLIFIFTDKFGGGGTIAGTILSIPLTLFMMALELLVAFLQAYIFVMLSATYIGSAIEEHHHAEEHH